jgi:Protein of unknown function (DUF2917)
MLGSIDSATTEPKMNPMPMQEMQQRLITDPAWLVALGGRLWVTRDGHLEDHVLAAGQRLALARGDAVTVGPFDTPASALWDWQPMSQPSAPAAQRAGFLRAGVGAAFALAARALRGAADGLAALARSAAAIACRAQGCIKAGDSMASAGTVQ